MKLTSAYENISVVILHKKVELTGMNISAHGSKSPKSSFDKKDNKWQTWSKGNKLRNSYMYKARKALMG